MEEKAPNRFEADLRDLSKTAQDFAAETVAAAEKTFATFADHEDSHYYCATGGDPEETWQALTKEVARVTAIAATEAADGGRLVVEDLELVHQGIFRPVFGERCLAMRRYAERVSYGIVLGERDEPVPKRQEGKRPRSLSSSLKQGVATLNKAISARDRAVREGRPRQVIDATRPAAQFYGKLLADHPYMDGNGRTAFPLLSFALIRLGLLAVAVPETREFHWCLGRAMRRAGRDAEPLAVYLQDLIVRSASAGSA